MGSNGDADEDKRDSVDGGKLQIMTTYAQKRVKIIKSLDCDTGVACYEAVQNVFAFVEDN